MTRLVSVAFYLILINLLAAQGPDFEWYKKIEKVKGRISALQNGEMFVIIPDANPNGRYISTQLPEEFKHDSLKVTFSGMVGKIPPNFRMLGTPLKLSCICTSQAEQGKFHLKKRKYSFK